MENIGDVRSAAPFMERVTLEDALSAKNIKLHPGALKYYEEIGIEIPEEMK